MLELNIVRLKVLVLVGQSLWLRDLRGVERGRAIALPKIELIIEKMALRSTLGNSLTIGQR